MAGKPILLDGSCGSFLWKLADERGIEKVPVWRYSIEHPKLVEEMHTRYAQAGSEMLQTNTFSLNALSAEGYSRSVPEIVSAAVRLARKAADAFGAKVYLSSGPLAAMLEPYGTLTKDKCRDVYTELVSAAADAGTDAIMLETFMDVRMAEIAASAAVQTGLPVICSMTFEKRHRTMMGDSVQKIIDTLSPLGLAGIGMNCSSGPVEALEVIREYASLTDTPLYFKPNSGMRENYSAEDFAREVSPALEFVSYIGACCGSDDEYIREIRKLISQ